MTLVLPLGKFAGVGPAATAEVAVLPHTSHRGPVGRIRVGTALSAGCDPSHARLTSLVEAGLVETLSQQI